MPVMRKAETVKKIESREFDKMQPLRMLSIRRSQNGGESGNRQKPFINRSEGGFLQAR
jgi:hypothetical protein